MLHQHGIKRKPRQRRLLRQPIQHQINLPLPPFSQILHHQGRLHPREHHRLRTAPKRLLEHPRRRREDRRLPALEE